MPKKKNNQNALNNGQWPFDREFYLILNQSVGDGSWAKKPDASFTYTTLFDWVRVYQKENNPETGIDSQYAEKYARLLRFAGTNPAWWLPDKQMVNIVDLKGRTVYKAEVQGNETVKLPQGVYVLNNKKVMVP